MTIGGRFEYPLCDNTARIGLKASVPFKTVRVERDDTAETAAVGDQTNVVHNLSVNVTVPGPAAIGTGPAISKSVQVTTNMYRLSFVKDLPFLNNGKMTKFVSEDEPSKDMAIGGKVYGNAIRTGYTDIPFVLISNADAKQIPFVQDFAVKMDAVIGDVPVASTIDKTKLEDGIFQVGKNAGGAGVIGYEIKELRRDGKDLKLDENSLYAFNAGESKENLEALKAAGVADKIWLLAVNKTDGSLLWPA